MQEQTGVQRAIACCTPTKTTLLCIAYGLPPTPTPRPIGGVAQTIAPTTTAPTHELGYLAGLASVVMLVGAGWLVSKR